MEKGSREMRIVSLSSFREASGLVILSAAGAKDLLEVAAGGCRAAAASVAYLSVTAGPSLARVPRARSG
jgi:hypothetical protein